jgi:hypothetical protein
VDDVHNTWHLATLATLSAFLVLTMRVTVYQSFKALPDAYSRLDSEALPRDVCCRLAWYRNLATSTVKDKSSLRIFGLEINGGEAIALLLARQYPTPLYLLNRRCLEGFSNLYTLSFEPIVSKQAGPPDAVAQAFVAAMVEGSAPPGRISFDSWDPASPLFDAFVQALWAKGYIVHCYFQFANLYEEVVGDTWESYLRRRSSRLHNLLERKSRRLSLAGTPRFEVIAQGSALDAAIDAYETVYRASWKPPEPYPSFMPGLIVTADREGWMRLGLLYLDEIPIAAQLWLVADGRATIYKLAHDQRYDALSPGSLLTAHVLRHLLAVEGLREVDFGRGGEPYKRLWLGRRRERWGLLAFNRRDPGALLEAARHLGAKRLRTLQHKLAGKLPD